jgi:hypothetical protein
MLGGSVTIDYKQNVERLYEDVARHLIDAVGPQTVFFQVDDAKHGAHRQDLASWAPDWSLLSSPAVQMYKDNRTNVVPLRPKQNYRFIEEPRVLAYIGYEVDVINSVSLSMCQNSQQDLANRKRYQKLWAI